MTTSISRRTSEFEEAAQNQALLLSWNEGPTKHGIVSVVRGVTTAGDSHFVEPEHRIAAFDNNGVLWSEQPTPFQFAFVIERPKESALQAPEWKDQQPCGCPGG